LNGLLLLHMMFKIVKGVMETAVQEDGQALNRYKFVFVELTTTTPLKKYNNGYLQKIVSLAVLTMPTRGTIV